VIQNLKSLVVSLDDDVDEATLVLSAKEAGPVTAAAIRAPGSVEILDTSHHILTLQDDVEINGEFFVNKGRGFVLADQHEQPPDAPLDLVRIDAVYNPVLRAAFRVEETRVGQRTDFDRLTVRVTTDGSVEPEWTIRYAAELVRRHLQYMLYFKEGGPPVERQPRPNLVSEDLAKLFRTPVDELAELSTRSRNSLSMESIGTLEELVSLSETEMLGLDNFGEKSLDEIVGFLREHGLRLGMKIEEREDGQMYIVDDGVASGTSD